MTEIALSMLKGRSVSALKYLAALGSILAFALIAIVLLRSTMTAFGTIPQEQADEATMRTLASYLEKQHMSFDT